MSYPIRYKQVLHYLNKAGETIHVTFNTVQERDAYMESNKGKIAELLTLQAIPKQSWEF